MTNGRGDGCGRNRVCGSPIAIACRCANCTTRGVNPHMTVFLDARRRLLRLDTRWRGGGGRLPPTQSYTAAIMTGADSG
jgi:hypothetical protein